MTTTLDIAALIGALVWPAVIIAVLLLYRDQIPVAANWLASRIRKLEFAGVSLELAVARPFTPDLSAGEFDLRHNAAVIQIAGSGAPTILSQLAEDDNGDYAEINLGTGNEWLTSRLFILAILFARMKGIKCFVFVETSGTVRRHFVGWAQPEKIRWALAKQHPWLEQAYAEAYSTVISNSLIVTNEGGLGYQHSRRNLGPSTSLFREFLQRVQALPTPAPITPESDNWVRLDTKGAPALAPTYEHAHWISSETLEQILGADLKTSTIRASEVRAKNPTEQMRAILSLPDRYVPVTTEEQRFEYLIDRSVVLNLMGKKLLVET